jgi:tRNA modification GTPase
MAFQDPETTIVAVATPQGRGGVGCVRLSGPRSHVIAGAVFRAAGGSGSPPQPGHLQFGRFLGRDGVALDHGYLVVFGPRQAYTGEPSAELWPHGSPAVLAELVAASVAAGAEPAGPGEFTWRALRNGRLDLARAEAVRDLVAARTLYQARVAFSQAEGELSRRLAPLKESLADLIARGEAAVEFVDESETHLASGALEAGLRALRASCAELLAGFPRGRVVREGATLVLVGLPNVGKSSLFNRLLERDRAIVTEVPGTTRDLLEESLVLDGVPVRLVDTAGLSEVPDPVEVEGVRRARAAQEEADLVLVVLDGSRPLEPAERESLARLGEDGPESMRTVAVVNKADLPVHSSLPPGILRVSARTGASLDLLRAAVRDRLMGSAPLESPVLTDARHARALQEASASLDRAASAVASGLTEECVLEDLRRGLHHLGTITGEVGLEAIYDRIFSTFCIGK